MAFLHELNILTFFTKPIRISNEPSLTNAQGMMTEDLADGINTT